MNKALQKFKRMINVFLTGRRHLSLFVWKRKMRMAMIMVFVAGALIYSANNAVERKARNRIYTSVNKIPYNKVGLLLGTGKFLSDGRQNLFYQFRIQAAVDLYKAGKVKYLVVSGDNSRTDYNEPAQMQEDLVAAGVDRSCIYLDHAGFRTFDSMVRLKKVFGEDSATVISQNFHNERALFIASKEGINAVAFNAREVKGAYGLKVQVRERFARVKLFLDYIFGTKPKFLGEKIHIPS
jgi:SanA protein